MSSHPNERNKKRCILTQEGIDRLKTAIKEAYRDKTAAKNKSAASRFPSDRQLSQFTGLDRQTISKILSQQPVSYSSLQKLFDKLAIILKDSDWNTAQSITPQRTNKVICRAENLADQIKGWFEALDYKFESYRVWEKNYFEWIIRIRTRRGYDRILVRGVAGEAEKLDVVALRKSVQKQATDEGWLVSFYRISSAAREETAKNQNIYCYTLDELIDEDADFGGYCTWLENEVRSKGIDKMYVSLGCKKQEIDPVTKQRIGVSSYNKEEGWIEGYVKRWLIDPDHKHLSVLGEFGTGKTWFALHYAWITLQKYQKAKKNGEERPRLPLVIPLREYANAVNITALFSEFFFHRHEIPLPGYSAFEELNRMGKLLLIFDGFDEMAARTDLQVMSNNFWELSQIIVPGAKAILTCRTEHFPEFEKGRALLNSELKASVSDLNLTGKSPQFEVLELEKFNENQVIKILSLKQATTEQINQVRSNSKLLDLARRPLMIDLVLEALPEINPEQSFNISRIYLYAVWKKMERDIKTNRTFTSMADKLYFICELFWDMFSSNRLSLNYRVFPDRIRRLFGSKVLEEKDFDHWHFDMMGQTILIRNHDGDYSPAHRSFLEFFVAYKLAAELGLLASDFTKIVREQSHIDNAIEPQKYLWSSYFINQKNDKGENLPIAPLSLFAQESIEKLHYSFGQAPLTEAILELLIPMLEPSESTFTRLLNLVKATKGKTEAEVGYVGGNAVTLLLRKNPFAIEGCDLSKSVILNADFTNSSLRNVDFSHADLAGCVFTKVFGSVFSVKFSPNGKLLAAGDHKGEIHLWSVHDNRLILVCNGHTDLIWSIDFDLKSNKIASISRDQTIKIWDMETGQCLKTLKKCTQINSATSSPDGDSVKFSPNGDLLVSGSGDQTIKLWDVETGQCLKTLTGHTGWVQSVAFNPLNGDLLATGSEDQTIKLWDIETGQCIKTLTGHIQGILSVKFSPNGELLVSGSKDQTVRLWDVKTGQCLKTLAGHTSWVQSVAFNPLNGDLLATGSEDQTIKLWDIETGQCIKTLSEYTSWVRSVDFHSGGYILVGGGGNQTIKLWDVKTGQCLKTLRGSTSLIRSIDFAQHGTTIASSSEDQTIKLWDVETGRCLKILHGNINSTNSVSFNPDGNLLASDNGDRSVRLWDVETGQCIKTLTGHTSLVRSVVFDQFKGNLLASGGGDQTIKLWDVETGQCLKTLTGHTGWIRSIVFGQNGNLLASGSEDQTIKLWNIETGQCLKTLTGHNSPVYSINYRSKDKKLVSSSKDMILIWDIETCKLIKQIKVNNTPVYSVILSPDVQKLASGGKDGIEIWNVQTGKRLNFLSNGLYTGMNITGVKNLDKFEITTLKQLGAL